jgi:hypothetical protein
MENKELTKYERNEINQLNEEAKLRYIQDKIKKDLVIVKSEDEEIV